MFWYMYVCMYVDDPLVPAIAQQLKTDKATHDSTARDWVRRYAQC